MKTYKQVRLFGHFRLRDSGNEGTAEAVRKRHKHDHIVATSAGICDLLQTATVPRDVLILGIKPIAEGETISFKEP